MGSATRLTQPQANALHIAVRDGAVNAGGVNATPGVRHDTVRALVRKGLMHWAGHGWLARPTVQGIARDCGRAAA